MAPLLLAVFDLDYTIWHPEMYQINGPPGLVMECSASSQISGKGRKKKGKVAQAPWTKTLRDGMVVADRNGTPMALFDGA